MKKYKLIYADPPWQFLTYSKKGLDKSADNHYECQDINWIKSLPVKDWAEDDSVLLMWVCDPTLPLALEVMSAWGFEYKTVAFTWAKQAKKNHDKWHMGCGYYTRSNPEMCLLGKRGKGLKRQNAGVRQLIVDPLREHSRKPDRCRDDIVKLFGDVPRLEMFARTKTDGWDVFGNETDKF